MSREIRRSLLPLSSPTLQRLLASIEAQNLVFLCGAGLSVPNPSNLMSAVAVSRACYDKYAPTLLLPPDQRDDIDQLAGYFFAEGLFEPLFINQLVPWDALTGEANAGHAAVADMLLCGAVVAALSANFDILIEQWCSQHKVSLRGALDGHEAVKFANESKPLLKFHGCMMRDREMTLWTQDQLTAPEFEGRINSCKNWMELNLPGRDLIIVGFWTDWGYLNNVLANALDGNAPASITVVDPGSTVSLEQKAPALWTILSASKRFEHVRASGNDVLEEIRAAFSKVWAKKLNRLGEILFVADKGACPPELLDAPDLDIDALYDLRRDAEGIARDHAARTWEPGQSAAQTGYAHLLLSAKTNKRIGVWYELGDQTIRVVHGAGMGMSTVQQQFSEPPSMQKADVIVCVGALEQGVPGNIIGKGQGSNVVRPEPGEGSRWMTLDDARSEFDL